MPRYCLRYKKFGKVTEFESFSDRDAFQAFLRAQSHTEPAELWKDGAYLVTLRRVCDGGAWQLYRERDVAGPCQAANP
jgi:hypothetical protein